jgi:predicted DCC family thiol-disulfide oxidoreductase YuxK
VDREIIYYDGHCGLCHGFVSFVLRHDPAGRFHFCPLDKLTTEQRSGLPDSVVVRAQNGRWLVKSEAALHVIASLPAPWRILARVARILPSALLDLGYDCLAKVRYRVFGRKTEACPLIPAEMRSRFDL